MLLSGDDNFWHIAESSLIDALDKKGWSYQVIRRLDFKIQE